MTLALTLPAAASGLVVASGLWIAAANGVVPGSVVPTVRSSSPVPAPAQKKVAAFTVSTTCPSLYIEGQPFLVDIVVTATGEKGAEVPVWLLTLAAWELEAKPLERREAEGALPMASGQSISTQLDLAPAIAERTREDARDFRVQYTEAGSQPTDVIYLAQPESGIDFMTLPKEQLSDYQVVLQTSGGPIWIETWPEVAPSHVRNFLDLCSSGFYDGSPFHRVIPGFMIQGGKAKDGSAPPRKQDQEFSTRRHARGVLSAARLDGDVNSATSEFFITHQPQPQLDGKYSAFGSVLIGMDAVEKIVKSVEVHYALMNAFARLRVQIDPSQDAKIAVAKNQPNPPQEIRQALVVKATKSRPKALDNDR